jgi:hypothetical protein
LIINSLPTDFIGNGIDSHDIVEIEPNLLITNNRNRMKKTLSIVVITGDNVHHVEQIKSTHPSPISQAMANVAYRYRKAGKGSPTILKAY